MQNNFYLSPGKARNSRRYWGLQRPQLNIQLDKTVSERGVAFVADGNLPETAFVPSVADAGVRFVRADAPVDTVASADEINAEFLELETQARESGAAMGAGYAFPLTIELVKEWTAGLEAKGLLLAPVSALTEISGEISPDDTLQTGSLVTGPVNPNG